MLTLNRALFKDCLQLIILTAFSVNIQGCDEGWFGQNCDFMCHCNTTTCGSDGECSGNDRCANGYFGPGCQYWNVAYTNGVSANPAYLRDQDETTCNPDTDATSVTVVLSTEVRLTWFRLHVNDGRKLREFKIILNEKEPCHRQTNIPVKKTVMDVVCDVKVLVKRLTLRGAVAPHVCSVYFSGGRNVAIKQNATQSSTYTGASKPRRADNAVDGNTDPYMQSDSCARTDVVTDGVNPEWSLTFSRPPVLHRVRVYNRSILRYRLQGFTLRTFSSNASLLDTFTDRSEDTDVKVYDVPLSSFLPVKFLIIQAGDYLAVGSRTVATCEVETYGEIVCPDNNYGLSCNKKCNCKVFQVCNQVTGYCSEGCPKGTYGVNCTRICSPSCGDNPCQSRTGFCSACPPGYSGDMCTKNCPSGTYGVNCSDCPPFCIDTCNVVTGTCKKCRNGRLGSKCEDCPIGKFGVNCLDCPPFCIDRCDAVNGTCKKCRNGRSGSRCEDCDSGFYGSECSQRCPMFCYRRMCHQLNGTCLECMKNHVGPRCEECPAGRHGLLCVSKCPWNCKNNSCDIDTGICSECEAPYEGPTCKEKGLIRIWMAVGLFLLLLAISVLLAFVKKQEMKKAKLQSEDIFT